MAWSQLLVGSLAGGAAGAILVFLSHLAPRFGAGNYIRDLEEPAVFGKRVSRREAHFIGVLVHLVMSVFFGFAFAVFVERGFFAGYDILPMLAWSVVITLVVGLVVMPIEGHGWFGRKHDAWFMADALLTNLLWGVLFLLLMRLWMVA